MKKKKFLNDLVSIPSPSGLEEDCTKVFNSYCSKFAEEYYQDKIGNSAYSIGTGDKKILLSGHIDELGLQVLKIEDSGMLIVYPNSIDKKVLPGSRVLVESKKGWIPGIIGKKPIHAESHCDRDTVNKVSEMLIDLGFTDKKEVEEMGIKVGSFVVYDRNNDSIDFGKDQILAPGLDDKLGLYIATRIGEELKNDSEVLEKYKIIIASTVQEEVGLRGATVLAQNIKPDISIDFDVTPSSDFGVDTKEWGDLSVGKGFVLEYGVDKSKRLCRLIENKAAELEINVQRVVTGRPGGTNTDVLQLFGGDCETCYVALPIRNLHTPVEICSWKDVDEAVKVITELIRTVEL